MKMPCVPSPIGAGLRGFFCFVLFSVLVMEPRASPVLDEHPTSEPQPQVST